MPWLVACKWLASSSGWETTVLSGHLGHDLWMEFRYVQDVCYIPTIFDTCWFTYIWLWLAMIELSTIEDINGHTRLISEIFNFTRLLPSTQHHRAPRPSKPPRLPVFVFKLPSVLLDVTWFTSSSHTQNTARYKASRWRNTMVWFEIPVDLHHLWLMKSSVTWTAKSLQVHGTWLTWCPPPRLETWWDVCIKQGGHNLQSECIRGSLIWIHMDTLYLYSSEVIWYWIIIVAWLHYTMPIDSMFSRIYQCGMSKRPWSQAKRAFTTLQTAALLVGGMLSSHLFGSLAMPGHLGTKILSDSMTGFYQDFGPAMALVDASWKRGLEARIPYRCSFTYMLILINYCIIYESWAKGP